MQRSFFHYLLSLLSPLVFASIMSCWVYADTLRLKADQQDAEVEVLEEQPDSFIVKIPKSEVELVRREKPTEIKLWKEKKILWEDQGDYLVLSLPKERIAPIPETTSEEGNVGYARVSGLEEGLTVTGAKRHTPGLVGLTGDITGRVLRDGRPLADCRVKLSMIQGPARELTRLLGGKGSSDSGSTTVEMTTGSDGVYLFEDVMVGDYDISWLAPGSTHWIGWLSDKPDVTVRAGGVTQKDDVEL